MIKQWNIARNTYGKGYIFPFSGNPLMIEIAMKEFFEAGFKQGLEFFTMSLTEQQLIERQNYIGGSDASTICGVNPYGNIIELWQEKLGLKEIEDISDKPVIRAGNYLEPVVAQWFEDDTGKPLEIAKDTFYHKSIPYMAANVDRLR